MNEALKGIRAERSALRVEESKLNADAKERVKRVEAERDEKITALRERHKLLDQAEAVFNGGVKKARQRRARKATKAAQSAPTAAQSAPAPAPPPAAEAAAPSGNAQVEREQGAHEPEPQEQRGGFTAPKDTGQANGAATTPQAAASLMEEALKAHGNGGMSEKALADAIGLHGRGSHNTRQAAIRSLVAAKVIVEQAPTSDDGTPVYDLVAKA